MTELHFEGKGRSLVVRKVTVGGYMRVNVSRENSYGPGYSPKGGGWRVIEAGDYLFQFKSKAKAIAYAKGLTGAIRKAKAVDNEGGLICRMTRN
jgi:hypothetical protein